MNKNKPKINISVDREHKDAQGIISEAFSDFEVQFDAGLIRKSVEDLPMQIMIFLSGAFVGGLAWDLFKLSIKKLFRKMPKAHVVLRDNNGIMYNVGGDLHVHAIVVPEKQKEFENIKTLDDLKDII